MNLRAWHACYTVSDVDRSLPFYRDLLGLELLRDKVREGEIYDRLTGYPNAKLRVAVLEDAGGFLVELVQYLEPKSDATPLRLCDPGAGHLSYCIDDLRGAYERFMAAGARTESPPLDLWRDGQLEGRVLYLYDPDGNIIELFEEIDG
jgi:catechol 2,3-dioxygenase-like lactoylglutathione lyase family enzyme